MASGPKSLNDFPDEILLNILSNLRPEILCFTIAKVCNRWNNLAKDVALWKTLSYKCYGTSDINLIAEVLTEAPALHSLIVLDRKDVADILEFLNHIHGDLRELILERCYLGMNGDGLLANIVVLYPDLDLLSLEGCNRLTSDGYGLIARLKKLTELNLSDCERLSGETVRLIVDSCQHLKRLSLDGATEILDGDVIHIIEKLGKQLTSLVLDGEGLTDVAYSYLNNCTRLQELEVSCCKNMTDTVLLEGFESMQELTSLHLTGGRNLTAQALSTFLHRRSMISMVSLSLSGCTNLDDKGLEGIAERCIYLKELAVCRCPEVTDAGISMIIRHCNKLRVLILMSLPLIKGNGYLGNVPLYLPHLRRLSLLGSDNVCDKYVDEIVEAAPKLEVMNSLGDIL